MGRCVFHVRAVRSFAVMLGVLMAVAVTAPAADVPPADDAFALRTVIIDAGHGGKDPGATNRWGLAEKDVVLPVALALRDYLATHAGDLRIVLTRDTDTYLTLAERKEIANRYDPRSSVYISIHCNSSRNAAARGVETYVYDNQASDTRAGRVAARENMGEDFDLNFIFSDLRHRAMVPVTNSLARHVQGHLVDLADLNDRRVRRGPFYVLFFTNMPSVLVEIGFITNREEQRRLASAAEQKRLAEAIGSAILAFGGEMDSWRLARMTDE